jgi:hypothetical protein
VEIIVFDHTRVHLWRVCVSSAISRPTASVKKSRSSSGVYYWNRLLQTENVLQRKRDFIGQVHQNLGVYVGRSLPVSFAQRKRRCEKFSLSQNLATKINQLSKSFLYGGQWVSNLVNKNGNFSFATWRLFYLIGRFVNLRCYVCVYIYISGRLWQLGKKWLYILVVPVCQSFCPQPRRAYSNT